MAKDKKSFLLYCDILPTFEELSDEEAGKLIKHILRYVNDKNPKTDDRIIKILFEPIKAQLKRDLKEWEAERSKRSEAGKIGGIKSGESRRSRSKRSNASKNEANEADNVTVTVNVNDNVTDNVIDITNTLTEHEIGKTIEFCSITLRREYTSARVGELWQAFLINGQKKFQSLPEKIKHFRNWIKTQPDETHKRTNTGGTKAKLGTSEARIEKAKNW